MRQGLDPGDRAERVRSLLSLALLSLALVLATAACTGEDGTGAGRTVERSSSDAPRLVLLWATCTLNRNYLSPYDPAISFTPAFGRFARDAVVFDRHITEAGQSGIAYASLFSGVHADRHGVYRHPTPLADSVDLIGEAFAAQGWDVVTWLEHPMASRELGYAQGASPDRAFDHKLEADDPVLAAVLERLDEDPSYRALLIANFTITHGPYRFGSVERFCAEHPSECGAYRDPEAFRFLADLYQRGHAHLSYDFEPTAELMKMSAAARSDLAAVVDLLYRVAVAELDRVLGSLLARLDDAGWLDRAIVALTADHGETLYRDNTLFKWTHGHQQAPEVLNVPLLIRAPTLELAAGHYSQVTRSIDVFPTLAGLAGVETENAFAKAGKPDAGQRARDGDGSADTVGVDLSPVLFDEIEAPSLSAFSHTSLLAEPVIAASQRWPTFQALYPRVDPELMWASLQENDLAYRLRRRPGGEPVPLLFDLAVDPEERSDLLDQKNPEHRQALRRLDDYLERLVAAWRERWQDQGSVDLERQEKLLRSLGYL